MDFSVALPTFIITLREGVEAALVVGIVLACLKKAKQSYLNPWVYGGIGAGIAASAIVGWLLAGLSQALSQSNSPYAPIMEPLLEGIFGLTAIAMLSWMLIWMTQQARSLKSGVEGAVIDALNRQNQSKNAAAWGVFTLIFVAVVREGFETVLFILSKFQQGFVPAIGAVAGLIVAIGIGVALFKLGIRINLRRFFQIMGVFLLLIVAGLVLSSLHNFDSAVATLSQMDRESQNLCFYYERFAKPEFRDCILGPMVWNTSKILPDAQFPGLVFKALFGYRDKIYLVQAVAYIGFLLTVGTLYFRSLGSPNLNSKKATS